MPDLMIDGKRWPKISIVTPSYNQGKFIEETIRSVLLQGYPDLEYIIMDGGSSDESVDIIKKYQKWIKFWNSRKDDGQASAISMGFEISTGTIQAWLNSDDIYNIGALASVAKTFSRRPKVGVVYGNRFYLDERSNQVGAMHTPTFLTKSYWKLGQPIAQESTFWRSSVYKRCGGLNKNLFFCMDYDLFVRMFGITKFYKLKRYLGAIRNHKNSKSHNYDEIMWKEFNQIGESSTVKQPNSLEKVLTLSMMKIFIIYEKICANAIHRRR